MTSARPRAADEDGLDIEAIVRNLPSLARTRMARVWGAAFVIGLVGLRLFSSEYSATAAFTASTRRPGGSLSGLAATVGLSIPGLESTNSPQYYADLLKSDEVLRRVSTHAFATTADPSHPRTLSEIWGLDTGDTLRGREKAIQRLSRSVSVSASQRTGVITYVVRTKDASLSEGVAKALLEELDSFNRTTRNSQAASERRFTQGRLAEATKELRDAEDRLEEFLARNRLFQSSPELSFKRDRLAREVATKQEVVNLLSQSFEQARIEEVRDTPALTTIESPRRAGTPDSGNWARIVMYAAVLAFLVAAADALAMLLRRRATNRRLA